MANRDDWDFDLDDVEAPFLDDGPQEEEAPASAQDHTDDDFELERLFLTFDEVRASDRLRCKTVRAADAEQRRGGLAHAARRGLRRRQPAKARRLRVAVTFALVLVVAGVVSYAIPVTHVSLAEDDLSIELGVNLYGVTVSATAAGDDGQTILQASDVRNKGYEEALYNVLDTYERLFPKRDLSEMDVDARGPMADKNVDYANGANRLKNDRVRQREERQAQDVGTSQGAQVAPSSQTTQPVSTTPTAEPSQPTGDNVPSVAEDQRRDGSAESDSGAAETQLQQETPQVEVQPDAGGGIPTEGEPSDGGNQAPVGQMGGLAGGMPNHA